MIIERLKPRHWTFLAIIFLVAGCSMSPRSFSSSSDQDQPLAQLGFVNLNQLPMSHNLVNPIRLQALRETATTLGARGALAWRSVHINTALQGESVDLDQVFDFNQLLLKNGVLPPVVSEDDGALNLANSDTIRTADKTYEIIFPARFVTTPPNWRDYLWMNFQKPDLPDTTLLPVNKPEAQIWNFYLTQGWQDGLQQANDIFFANLNRLKRDYLGMVLYRKLLAEKIISSPIVAKADLGVTGNGQEIRINDEITRITAHAALQPDSTKWNPVLTNGNLSP